jgi:hypothetical protein
MGDGRRISTVSSDCFGKTHHDGLCDHIVTVFRAHGLWVVIFVDDHFPAQVHVFGDGQTKINLIGPDGALELIWTEGTTRAEVREAVQVVTEQRAILWRDGGTFMAELTDANIDAATTRSQAARLTEPHAASVHYDRRRGRVVIDLTNGCTFSFRPVWLKDWRTPPTTN